MALLHLVNVQKILSGERITLPFTFVSKYGLKEGDVILVDETPQGLLIVPAEVKPRK